MCPRGCAGFHDQEREKLASEVKMQQQRQTSPAASPQPSANAPAKPLPVSLPEYYRHDLVRKYKLIEEEDASVPAFGFLRKACYVLVPPDISADQLKATLVRVILDTAERTPDIDAISVNAYKREMDIRDDLPAAVLEWCPNGNWGDVKADIARSNDRSSYKYVIVYPADLQ